ncbi:MAG: hypothetical protein ACK5LC_00825 [Coprobacillaceae bacterium]
MKNKKRRKDFVKPMRLLTIISMVVLIACLLAGFISGDFVNTGFYALLFGFAVFIILHVIQYRMMFRCRCKKCGHVEVFETKRMVITGVKGRCPKCNSKLKVDEVIE